jgi:hypothetical protein
VMETQSISFMPSVTTSGNLHKVVTTQVKYRNTRDEVAVNVAALSSSVFSLVDHQFDSSSSFILDGWLFLRRLPSDVT